jgi:hypothetical protein
VYVEGIDLLKTNAEGKLVRVEGTLAVRRVPAANSNPAGPSQGPSGEFVYFVVIKPEWRVIDRVRWPYLEVVDE